MGLSSLLGVSSKALDSSLSALFSSSVGPAKLDKTVSATRPKKTSKKVAAENVDEDDEEEEEEEEEEETVVETAKDRKRKRKQADEELETKYLEKLAAEDQPQKRIKAEEAKPEETKTEDATSDAESDAELVHESLKKPASGASDGPPTDIEKANRTVFIANVAVSASTSKTDKKALMAHLSTVLTAPETIESIRFRSLAFATAAMPKRAAYITKATQTATTPSCNAYVVYSTVAAARKACSTLNGTTVLDRHIRVDSVAHPAPIDSRRCVFVGNLGFVDDESVFATDAKTGTVERKKRNKVPSDIEEGLWRTFSQQAGPVESVRVIRDPVTRVGKGFAYVQFHDSNHVEKALLLNEKKFPPMLPRALRVTRAKDPKKTNNAMERSKAKAMEAAKAKAAPKSTSLKYVAKTTAEEQSMAGRAAKLLGKAGAHRQARADKSGRRDDRNGAGRGERPGRSVPEIKTPENVILEGRRASAKDGKPNDIKFSKKGNGGVKKKKRLSGRRAERAQEWKKKGSK